MQTGKFMEKAGKSGFFIHYKQKITHKKGSRYQRIILQLKKTKTEIVDEQELSIKSEDDSFTEAYIKLTRDFYIDF